MEITPPPMGNNTQPQYPKRTKYQREILKVYEITLLGFERVVSFEFLLSKYAYKILFCKSYYK